MFLIEGVAGAGLTGSKTKQKFEFEIFYFLNNFHYNSKDIAIDDIIGVYRLCPKSNFCDFESEDICGFTNGQQGLFNWTRNKGQFSNYFTGPSFDHVILYYQRTLEYIL